MNDLGWRVVRTAAHTMAGFAIKARVSLWTLCNSTAELEQEWRDTLEEQGPLSERLPIYDHLTTSLLLDLLHINCVEYAAGPAVRA